MCHCQGMIFLTWPSIQVNAQDPQFIKIITGFFALIAVPPESSQYSPGAWLMMTGESAPSSVSNERISHSLPSWRATTSSTLRFEPAPLTKPIAQVGFPSP